VTIDGGGSLLHHLLSRLFSLKSNKTKVLWFVILALVNRPHHLCHRSELCKVSLNVLHSNPLCWQLPHVDLALLGLGLLAGHLLTLDNMRLLSTGRRQAISFLEHNEGESS